MESPQLLWGDAVGSGRLLGQLVCVAGEPGRRALRESLLVPDALVDTTECIQRLLRTLESENFFRKVSGNYPTNHFLALPLFQGGTKGGAWDLVWMGSLKDPKTSLCSWVPGLIRDTWSWIPDPGGLNEINLRFLEMIERHKCGASRKQWVCTFKYSVLRVYLPILQRREFSVG